MWGLAPDLKVVSASKLASRAEPDTATCLTSRPFKMDLKSLNKWRGWRTRQYLQRNKRSKEKILIKNENIPAVLGPKKKKRRFGCRIYYKQLFLFFYQKGSMIGCMERRTDTPVQRIFLVHFCRIGVNQFCPKFSWYIKIYKLMFRQYKPVHLAT